MMGPFLGVLVRRALREVLLGLPMLTQGITELISAEPRRKSAKKLLGLTMEMFSDDIDTEDLDPAGPSAAAEAKSAQEALMESIRAAGRKKPNVAARKASAGVRQQTDIVLS